MWVNPFDLSGPSFLVFYLFAGGITLIGIRILLDWQESSWPVPRMDLTDPYAIAYLRGGEKEALAIATFSLVDRGFLELNGQSLKTKTDAGLEQARRPIEKAILRKCKSFTSFRELYRDENMKLALVNYKNSLSHLRLISEGPQFRPQRIIFRLGFAILFGLAVIKIIIAIDRGHANFMFLVVLCAVFNLILHSYFRKRRTSLGEQVLLDLKFLFKDLLVRAPEIQAGGSTNEAALLAAVFGVSVLPLGQFPYADNLMAHTKPASAHQSGSAVSDSWSSCGSFSGGSSCSSSCGGGGCGGCGGCGGS